MTEIKSKVVLDTSISVEQIKTLAGAVQGIIDDLEAVGATNKKVSEDQAKFNKGVVDGTNDAQRAREKANKKSVDEILHLDKQYQELIKTIRSSGDLGQVVAAGAPGQLTGIVDGVSKVKNSLLSELPFGGLVGLMMFGAKRDEEVRASGAEVARMFQQAGQVGQKEMNAVAGDVRRLSVMLGKGPTGMAGEIAASASAFAQAGIDIKDVVESKFEAPIKGSKGSVLETAAALDSLFKLGGGTSAKLMSEMIKNFNMSASESASAYASIGLAARDSGTSVTAFAGSVMQSATALRTQRVDIMEVADAQLKFQSILQQKMPGVSAQFAADYAQRGIGQVSQGMAGMSVGLSAEIGKRISARTDLGGGKQIEGLDAHYAMREGFAGKGQDQKSAGIFQESIVELGKLAKQAGRTESEQRFFLEKMGFGFEGSKAIIDISNEAKDSKTLQAAIKKHGGELNSAFIDRAKETSTFQKDLIKAQEGLAKIGAGMLGALINGFQLIYESLQALAETFTGNQDGADQHWGNVEKILEATDKNWKKIVDGGKDLFKAGAGVYDTVIADRAAPVSRRQGEIGQLGSVLFGGEKGRQGVINQDEHEERERTYKSATAFGVSGDTASSINRQLLQLRARRLEHELEKTNLSEKEKRELSNTYQTEEAKTGLGAGALRKALKGRSGVDADIGYKVEEQMAAKTRINYKGKQLVLKVSVDEQPMLVEPQ